jgi:hypothetical protein
MTVYCKVNECTVTGAGIPSNDPAMIFQLMLDGQGAQANSGNPTSNGGVFTGKTPLRNFEVGTWMEGKNVSFYLSNRSLRAAI